MLHEEQDACAFKSDHHFLLSDKTSLCSLCLSLHADALSAFRKHLTAFEQREIEQYMEVWYHGIAAEKVQETCTLNHGYDDIKGHYKMVHTKTCPPEGSYHKPFQSRRICFVGFSEM